VGGEEFAWILPETGALDAYLAAERAREEIRRSPYPGAGWLTISCGVCDLDGAASAEELFRNADGAMYWAKTHGRDATFCYSEDVARELSFRERPPPTGLEQSQAASALRALARAVDAKDPRCRDHSHRVAGFAAAIATELGWSEDEIARLREAGLVHDVGKIGVPQELLSREGPLDPDEYEEVKRHAKLGGQMVGEVLDAEQAAWVAHHHERWDGLGYPDGLSAEAIPEGARLLALADAWDAMTWASPNRIPMSEGEALRECRAASGSQFWPEAVVALERLTSLGGLSPSAGPGGRPTPDRPV
jgi:hypothetical protein